MPSPTSTHDARYLALKRGIEQLSRDDISKVIDCPADKLLLDGGNYDEATGRYCPLAVALDAPQLVKEPTDESVREFIAWAGQSKYGRAFVFNQMRGTPGGFYRDDRLGDLMTVAVEAFRGKLDED